MSGRTEREGEGRAGCGAGPGSRSGADERAAGSGRIAPSAPESAVADRLAHLQHSAGNTTVVRLLRAGEEAAREAPEGGDPAWASAKGEEP
ncbi:MULTISPECIES: hypothetical protein [unclassified Streptomyces]|uniref:hypothetical protein n=1 Tax=unclassified Streptomyces TaxID=2593676 RepID=UPI000F6C208E|nr:MULTISPECIES: hypothetical protein [unclassified Streptomyces]AZM62753.1 hypothetical protein DLM49_27360 [Streptomyces sp. WAC 01438]RSM90234.1 hypothetical protein DMA10_29155 [Streptomyces sp. WAC 01420]